MTHSLTPKCDKCGYEFTGLPMIGRCPECGNSYNLKTQRGVHHDAHDMYKLERLFRRGRTIALALSIVVVLGCAGCLHAYGMGRHAMGALGLFAFILFLMTITSFLYEKD